ncbi:hypothetical protein PFISCL1PPCAC_4734, partial [Pristionchus fissidentatus]
TKHHGQDYNEDRARLFDDIYREQIATVPHSASHVRVEDEVEESAEESVPESIPHGEALAVRQFGSVSVHHLRLSIQRLHRAHTENRLKVDGSGSADSSHLLARDALYFLQHECHSEAGERRDAEHHQGESPFVDERDDYGRDEHRETTET